MPGSACEQLAKTTSGCANERRLIISQANKELLSRRELELLEVHAEELSVVVGSASRTMLMNGDEDISAGRTPNPKEQSPKEDKNDIVEDSSTQTRVHLEEQLMNLLRSNPEITIGAAYPKLGPKFPSVSKMRMKKIISECRSRLAATGLALMDACGSASAVDRVGDGGEFQVWFAFKIFPFHSVTLLVSTA